MSEEYILVRDIVCDHNERMLNIKKYYPYFKLVDNAFSQYQGGAYSQLDMGYILMAVLRFFIEENNFREKDVSYGEYARFTGELIRRDFGLSLSESEEAGLVQYIFDKIKNDGHPFVYEYFDPEEKKKKSVRMRLIESKIKDDSIYYYISSDAIEFYLDTKEIKDESSISVAQILLGKMISSRNFKGGVEVVKRINNEVGKLKLRKNEVLSILSHDVFAGIKVYEEFVDNVMSWFDEEQKLYHKNMDMIEELLKRNDGRYTEAFSDIYVLETELKKSLGKHSELLGACTDLQKKADEIIYNAKFSKLKRSFDFKYALKTMIEADSTQGLAALVVPMMDLKIKKSFSFSSIDKLLTCKGESEEKGDIIVNKEEVMYVYDDEIEEERITDNYQGFIKVLFDMLISEGEFGLSDLNDRLTEEYGKDILKNGDYYSFIIHLSQKNSYDNEKIAEKPDTFLEEHIVKFLEINKDERYKELSFNLEFNPEKTLKLMDLFEITDIRFTKGKKVA